VPCFAWRPAVLAVVFESLWPGRQEVGILHLIDAAGLEFLHTFPVSLTSGRVRRLHFVRKSN
jgi:hypothetical protein